MKTVILKRNAVETPSIKLINSTLAARAAYSSIVHSSTKREKVSLVRLNPHRGMYTLMPELGEAIGQAVNLAAESLPQPQGGAAPVVQDTPQGFTALQPIPGLPGWNEQAHFMGEVLRANLYLYNKNNNIYPISGLHNPILYNSGGAGPSTSTPPILYNSGGAGPSTSTPPMDFSPAVTLWSRAQQNILDNLSMDNLKLEQHKRKTPDQLMRKAEDLYTLKCAIITQLKSLAGRVNGQILWNTDDACDAIRRQDDGSEYNLSTLKKIHCQFRNPILSHEAQLDYNKFTDSRLDSIPQECYQQLQGQHLPLDSLDYIHHINFGCPWKNLPPLTNQINLERNPGAGNVRFIDVE
jgi:hypothetical protein